MCRRMQRRFEIVLLTLSGSNFKHTPVYALPSTFSGEYSPPSLGCSLRLFLRESFTQLYTSGWATLISHNLDATQSRCDFQLKANTSGGNRNDPRINASSLSLSLSLFNGISHLTHVALAAAVGPLNSRERERAAATPVFKGDSKTLSNEPGNLRLSYFRQLFARIWPRSTFLRNFCNSSDKEYRDIRRRATLTRTRMSVVAFPRGGSVIVNRSFPWQKTVGCVMGVTK